MARVHRRRQTAGRSLSPPLVRYLDGAASALHAEAMPTGDVAEIWVCRPLRPALVMGSAQRADRFNEQGLADAGIELALRRSGGGAVFIDPVSTVWVDVVAPRGSGWFHDDLAETFRRVGRTWQRALAELGVAGELFDEPPLRGDHAAREVCWAGVGWGEVLVGGVKIVGLSQRRTRWGARVQAMAVLDGGAGRAVDWFVDVDDDWRAAMRARVGSLVVDVAPRDLEAAVVEHLADDGV